MRSISNKSLINLLLFLVWMLVILVGYYINHKPMEAGTLSAPVSALFDVLGAFLIMLIIGGIGRIALPAPSLSPLERFGLQAALGVGIMSLFWLLLGELHLYYRWTPFLMLFLLLVYKPSLAWIKELSTLGSVWKQSQLLEKWLGGFSVVLAANQLFLALCPPTRWDALAYHLQLPRLFLEQNSIQIIPSNPYWGQAQVGEMLFTWAVSLYRAETAAVLCWMVGMTFLVGVFGFTSRHTARMISSPAGDPSCPDHSPTAGWMAVAALLSGLTFRSMLSGSYTDIFAAFMGLAVLVALFAWLDSREGTWLVWVGVFIGLAMGVKLTAGILAPAIVVFTLVNRKNNGTPSKFFIWSILLAILFFLPWILKNWSGTGNPLYPYFFPTQWVSALRLSAAIEMSSQTDWLEQLFLPITLTWRGVENGWSFGSDPGPLLLLFAIPGLWFFRKQAKAHAILLSLLFGWIAISLGGAYVAHLRQTRLYFVLLPGAALACGWGWEYLQQINLSGVRLRRVAGAIGLLVIGLAVWQDINSSARLNPIAVITGAQSREKFLDASLGWYSPAIRSLAILPPESRVLMLWEPRGFYAPISAVPDPWIDRWRMDRWTLGNSGDILSAWKRQGFTHLLFYKSGADFVRQEPGLLNASDWQVLDDLLAILPAPQSFGDVYLLYTLDPLL